MPFSVAAFLIAMFGHRIGGAFPLMQHWVELALAAPVVLWAGLPIFARFVQSLLQRSPTLSKMIGLGTGAAFIYSV
ncbi:copper-transporting ATPase, partial [Mycobacterium tuberculosis]|nr:copper-transporting ATPase [Mycobacterium tuberculosis]